MADEQQHALSHVLDQLESAAHGDRIKVEEVVDKLGHKSFAALMLVFSLISPPPRAPSRASPPRSG